MLGRGRKGFTGTRFTGTQKSSKSSGTEKAQSGPENGKSGTVKGWKAAKGSAADAKTRYTDLIGSEKAQSGSEKRKSGVKGWKAAKLSTADAKTRLARFTVVDNEYKDLHAKWVEVDHDLAVFWQKQLEDDKSEFLTNLRSFYLKANEVLAPYGDPKTNTEMTRQSRMISKEISGVNARTAEVHKKLLSEIMADAFTLLDAVRQGLA